jgi:hypothetical protein
MHEAFTLSLCRGKSFIQHVKTSPPTPFGSPPPPESPSEISSCSPCSPVFEQGRINGKALVIDLSSSSDEESKQCTPSWVVTVQVDIYGIVKNY